MKKKKTGRPREYEAIGNLRVRPAPASYFPGLPLFFFVFWWVRTRGSLRPAPQQPKRPPASYVNPGKWAAVIDGGARFGMDMLAPMIFFNISAMICHYIAVRITLITRKDLAQICSQEYDKWICIFLRVQTLISVVALDLTMVLGIAYGLHLLFGMDLRCCVCLTTLDAMWFPFFSTLLQQQVVPGPSVSTLCKHHLLAIFFVFGGISFANYALINLASSIFYNSGLLSITFPDDLSLTEQILRGPVAPLPFLLILYVGSQITSLTWNVHGQVISQDLLGLHIPSWTIRIISIVPALFCVCLSGDEGIYQLLIFAQVLIALLLPFAVIPLFRVASSQALMGHHKISDLWEYVAIVSIMVMFGSHIKLVAEMIIGYSDMFGNFQPSKGSSSSVLYVLTACSCCFMLWPAATTLKSSTRVGGQVGNQDIQNTEPETVEVDSTEHVGKTSDLGADLPTPKEDDNNSRLVAALGCASRLELAAVLDDFWEQLYDLHGQPRCGFQRDYTQMLSYYIQDCQRGSLTSSERPSYDVYSPRTTDSSRMSTNTKKYHRQLDISEVSTAYMSENRTQWDNSSIGSGTNSSTKETPNPVDQETAVLQSLRSCILKLLRLEGSDWLFGENGGFDEDLIDHVAAKERWLYEVETRKMGCGTESGDQHSMTNIHLTTIPYCGEGCIWTMDLIVSFGIWCIRRILDLSLMETRPELWGKYTYVLNRLQGIVDPAFSEPRTPLPPCVCLQLSAAHQQQMSSPPANSMLPPTSKPRQRKCTNASKLLDLIKAIEIAISGRKGRSGTASAKAFQKGKENLHSVLARYKRRLANKGSK